VISTDRTRRPSDFIRRPVAEAKAARCPFDAGAESQTPHELLAYRDSGAPNQPGWRVRVFPNRFPALVVEGDLNREGEGLYDKMNGIGAHEVIVETPDHGATLADLSEARIAEVFWAAKERINDLKRDRRFRSIVVFRNYGEIAGASLEHPHSQVIALPVIPPNIREEVEGARRYFKQKERCVFCDVLRQEAGGSRVVAESDRFVMLEPYAPRFPFETWVIPKRHESHFEAADHAQIHGLSWMLRTAQRRIDSVLERPACNLMVYSAPVQEGALDYYHWRLEITPRVARTAGFEWGTGFHINPTPPEEAAKFLRDAG
jgi:UDPglucose--hexose-1-phosphate uridylyltransferase